MSDKKKYILVGLIFFLTISATKKSESNTFSNYLLDGYLIQLTTKNEKQALSKIGLYPFRCFFLRKKQFEYIVQEKQFDLLDKYIYKQKIELSTYQSYTDYECTCNDDSTKLYFEDYIPITNHKNINKFNEVTQKLDDPYKDTPIYRVTRIKSYMYSCNELSYRYINYGQDSVYFLSDILYQSKMSNQDSILMHNLINDWNF
ncbi:hypothetical protein WAF17_05875 [Bernardetia sp. ABR2-2B]|uniref:hypothetical protein n=1 Tax=Bernardetia sp. ABR2-2B TaxID=3127472 RepID=UPI0030D5723B